MNNKLKNKISIIRSFNRFYTNVLGLLDQHILKSEFSLSEVRVLYEIEKTENCTSKNLIDTLCIDSGYLSRILKQFEKCDIIKKQPSLEDGRVYILSLTPKGIEKINDLNTDSNEQIFNLIQFLPKWKQACLVKNMTSIQNILDSKRKINLEEIKIRHDIRNGDAGYIIYMHGWIYREEYDYTTAFEGYVAQSFYTFLLNYNPTCDRLWVAEHNGKMIGCIGIVGHDEQAQLRWFLLHPDCRGIGLGKHLLKVAITYCKEKKFKSVYLETTSDLDTAITMYTKEGFVKVEEKANNLWRDDITELKFEMQL